MRAIKLGLGISALMLSAVAQADDLDSIDALAQDAFRGVSEDLGAMTSYKGMQPAESLGIIGFDVGLDVSYTGFENSDEWGTATGGGSVSGLPMARLRVAKGLPFGIDVGGFYSTAPGSNIDVTGAELRYAIIDGGLAMPAVGLRGAYTTVGGVDDLEFDTSSVDLSISKGFAMLTPYAGVGRVWVDSDPDSSTGLDKESFDESKVFVGARLNLMAMKITLEGDQTGDATTYGAKLSFGF